MSTTLISSLPHPVYFAQKVNVNFTYFILDHIFIKYSFLQLTERNGEVKKQFIYHRFQNNHEHK